MGSWDERRVALSCGTVGYAFAVAGFVAAARLGWVPGIDEPTTGFLGAYRLAVALASVVLAVALGAGAAAFGAFIGGGRKGLLLLVVGGIATGAALTLAPWILYPNDRYSPAFVWLLLGAPVGLLSWAICAILFTGRSRRSRPNAG